MCAHPLESDPDERNHAESGTDTGGDDAVSYSILLYAPSKYRWTHTRFLLCEAVREGRKLDRAVSIVMLSGIRNQ